MQVGANGYSIVIHADFVIVDYSSPGIEFYRVRVDRRGHSHRLNPACRGWDCCATRNKMVKSFSILGVVWINIELFRLMSISLVIMLAAETYCAFKFCYFLIKH